MVLIALPAFAQEEVVVEGEALDATSTPSQVTVVDPDTLPSSADVATAVERAPGVVVRRLGGQGDLATVGIRGAGARQTEVLIDGIPLNPEGGAAVDLSELPLRAFERVEIYRGAAPILLGTTALGGAVALVPGEGTGATLAVGAGSWSTARGTATLGQPLPFGHLWAAVDGLSTGGDFRYLDDGGTRIDDGDDRFRDRQNNDTGALATLARFSTTGDGPRLILLHTGLVRSDGVPGFTFAETPTVRYGLARHLVGARVDGDTGGTALGLRGFGVVRTETLSDPNHEIGIGGRRSSRDQTTSIGADGTARIPLRRDLRLDAAIGARSDRFDGEGLPDVRGRQVGRGVLALPLSLGGVAVVPGLVGLVVAGEETRWLGLPRLGAVVRGAGWALKGNVGAFARPPDLLELYGDRGALVGNPDLRPEHGLQLDLGPTFEREGARLEVVGFAAFYDDLVSWVSGPQGVARPVNLDRADVTGLEVAAAVGRAPWTAGCNGTLTRAVNRSEPIPTWVPRVPVADLGLNVGLDLGWLRLSVDGTAAAGTWSDTANFVLQPPRTFLGATVDAGSDRIRLELDVRNLLDTVTAPTLRDPLSEDGVRVPRSIVDFTGYPLPGRSLLVTLRMVP